MAGRGRGGHHAGHRRHRHQRHRPLASTLTERGRRRAARPGILAVTPVLQPARRRPGSTAHFRAVAAATDLPVLLYDIPVRTGPQVGPRRPWSRLAREVPTIVGVKDAAGDPAARPGWWPRPRPASSSTAATTPSPCPSWPSARSGVISVAAHWAGAQIAEMVAAFFKGDVDRARRDQRPPARVLRFQSERRRPEPAAGQGHAAGPGPPGRPVPAAHRAGARRASKHRAPRSWRRLHARAPVAAASEPAGPWLTRSGSSSSAGWARSGATAPASRSTGGSSSSTAGSCSPTPTCPASTWCCPTSPTCATNADRVEACILTHGHEDHTGGLGFLLRELEVPDLRLRADPRPGPQPHRGGRAARPDRASSRSRDGERRRIGPVRRGVHPGHPLGAPRLRHRLPHPPGRDPALGRLQDRPARRSTAGAPTWPASAPSPPTTGIRLLLSDSTNAEEPGHTVSERPVGRVLRDLFAGPPGQADHRGLLRQPHPPGPADRRRRHGQRPDGGHPRAVHGQERRPGPRLGLLHIPDDMRWSTSRRSATSTPARCASSRPAPRASPCRRCRSWPRARTSG